MGDVQDRLIGSYTIQISDSTPLDTEVEGHSPLGGTNELCLPKIEVFSREGKCHSQSLGNLAGRDPNLLPAHLLPPTHPPTSIQSATAQCTLATERVSLSATVSADFDWHHVLGAHFVSEQYLPVGL